MMKMIKCPFLSFPSPFIPNCFYMKKNLFHQYYAILVILSYKKTKQHWDDNVSYMNKTEKWFYYVNIHIWFFIWFYWNRSIIQKFVTKNQSDLIVTFF